MSAGCISGLHAYCCGMQFVRLGVCIFQNEAVMTPDGIWTCPCKCGQGIGVLGMACSPLQLLEMQLKQGVLRVLPATDLPMRFKAWPRNAYENGHQAQAQKAFNQGKACNGVSKSYFHISQHAAIRRMGVKQCLATICVDGHCKPFIKATT